MQAAISTGGFFEGVDFITAFSDCNASAGLVLGSSIALMFTFVFYRALSDTFRASLSLSLPA